VQTVLLQRMDGTQYASTDIAHAKAVTAVRFKRPTKAFEDALSAGGAGLRVLALDGAMPFQGGLPIIADGKIVGAIGVSGGTPSQDGLIAAAGAAAVAAGSK
jgi:glc operon protein GlcG